MDLSGSGRVAEKIVLRGWILYLRSPINIIKIIN